MITTLVGNGSICGQVLKCWFDLGGLECICVCGSGYEGMYSYAGGMMDWDSAWDGGVC